MGNIQCPKCGGIAPVWVKDNDLLEVEVCTDASSFEGRRVWSEKVSIKFNSKNNVIDGNWK